MRNKVKDVLYCNVDREKILNVSPIFNHENLWYFYEWLVERYKIHLKKDVEKMLPPWTTDKVLLKYRFTNVRREHDRETKWLINNICLNSNLSYENKLLNIILFRLFNKSRTIEIIGLADFEKLNFDEILKKISEFRESNEKYVWFSNAFFTSGPKSVSNKLFGEGDVVLNVIKLVERYNKLGIIDKIKLSGSQKEVYDNLLSLPGIGSFLAYQIFVDFSYLSEFPFSENEFVVAGPGCKKGLNLLFDDFGGLRYEEALFWIRDNQNRLFQQFGYNSYNLFSDLPEEERYLNLMSLENCMCEISKYIRAINGEGRPRIRYKLK